MKIRTAGAAALSLIVALAAGCPRTPREQQALEDLGSAGVIVTYTLVNRCGTLALQDGPGVTAGGPDHILLVYNIDTIQNEGPRAEDFVFRAEQLYVPTDLRNRVFSEGGVKTHSTLTVPAHTTQPNAGWVVMRYATGDQLGALGSAPGTYASLRYEERRGDQPVLIVPAPRRAPVQNLQTCNPQVLPTGRRFL